MNVGLAAAVMSGRVAAVMEELDEKEFPQQRPMAETIQFIRHSNRFFDLSNVRSAPDAAGRSESVRTRNPDLAPYYRSTDDRLNFFKHFQVESVSFLIRAVETYPNVVRTISGTGKNRTTRSLESAPTITSSLHSVSR